MLEKLTKRINNVLTVNAEYADYTKDIVGLAMDEVYIVKIGGTKVKVAM